MKLYISVAILLKNEKKPSDTKNPDGTIFTPLRFSKSHLIFL